MTAGLMALSHSARGQVEVDNPNMFGPMIEASDDAFQVRVEQRIIIRIPRQTSGANSLGSRSSAKIATVGYKEQKIGKCLLMDRLVGSRPGTEDGLDLVTRDGALIRAYLGDAHINFCSRCQAEVNADARVNFSLTVLFRLVVGVEIKLEGFGFNDVG